MNKINKDHLTAICKLGCGKDTCCYLGCSSDGWVCLKLTEMRATIAIRKDQMAAQGDNCDGIGETKEEIPVLHQGLKITTSRGVGVVKDLFWVGEENSDKDNFGEVEEKAPEKEKNWN